MARRLAGLVGALLAGAWIGFAVEWLSESGDWHGTQEMHLAAAAGRAALCVSAAFGLVEAWLWRRPDRWVLRLVMTSMVGAIVFVGAVFVPNSVAYYSAFPEQRELAFEAGGHALRLLFFAAQILLIMSAVIAIGSGIVRGLRWLVSADLPGTSARSMADR
jgi:hypothetical protein